MQSGIKALFVSLLGHFVTKWRHWKLREIWKCKHARLISDRIKIYMYSSKFQDMNYNKLLVPSAGVTSHRGIFDITSIGKFPKDIDSIVVAGCVCTHMYLIIMRCVIFTTFTNQLDLLRITFTKSEPVHELWLEFSGHTALFFKWPLCCKRASCRPLCSPCSRKRWWARWQTYHFSGGICCLRTRLGCQKARTSANRQCVGKGQQGIWIAPPGSPLWASVWIFPHWDRMRCLLNISLLYRRANIT